MVSGLRSGFNGQEISIMNIGAEFSPDKKYRFALWRIWHDDKPLVMFIGLNPSTANERKDDPTIRRVTRFAYDWGYGGFFMMNLFPFVTPYPSMLIKDRLEENDQYLLRTAEKCNKVVFSWGSFSRLGDRPSHIMKMFPDAHCFGKSKSGNPLHPLYLPSKLKPILFHEDIHL